MNITFPKSEELVEKITEGLDRIEEKLPAVPARFLHLQRAMVRRTAERTEQVWETMWAPARKILDRGSVATNTVTGQTRAAVAETFTTAKNAMTSVVEQFKDAAGDLADVTSKNAKKVSTTARKNAKTVTGQAKAQGKQVAKTARTATLRSVNKAISEVEGGTSSVPYEKRTKAELVELAKGRGIEGRTTMSKPQLIKALRA